MIPTVFDNQHDLLKAISTLHNGGKPFQADLTYGKGMFWRGGTLDFPEIRADLDETLPNLTHPGLYITNLPFRDCELSSVVVDLPFIHAAGKDSIMGNRFSSLPSQKALNTLHYKTAVEAYRILAPGGILVWKCQDIVESGKQVWNHILIYQHCIDAGSLLPDSKRPCGFTAVDLFILTRNVQVVGHNHGVQQHARRAHSYVWVFKK